MTNIQINRLYNKAYHLIMRNYLGGGSLMFGVDWITLKNELPTWYETLKIIINLKD